MMAVADGTVQIENVDRDAAIPPASRRLFILLNPALASQAGQYSPL
ncbi:hypothetical protein C7476_11990 [Phyllobacterium bourgognense]|uniref:Uncharacterized protein n=1 Tax=Phyllobacterium bourgognense TaxID=314236 RepID=A0A368YHP3_9HYPH|nr:hypothetical protein C7476_11990 [Phyllobacterium bourgognense]